MLACLAVALPTEAPLPRARRLSEELAETGRLPVDCAARWLGPLADHLARVHARGESVGPFGPANIVSWSAERDTPERWCDRIPAGELVLDESPAPRGHHRAPELTGLAPATPASDIYSFAAVLYESLTGEPYRRRSVSSPGRPVLNVVLRLALSDALHVDPAMRGASPHELLRRLGAGR